jgi:hypothetical protein
MFVVTGGAKLSPGWKTIGRATPALWIGHSRLVSNILKTSHMKIPIQLALFLAAISSFPSLRATTVIPPTFDELVDQAEVIFQGTVTRVKSEWVGEGAERHIMSYVTFNVEDTMKGNAGSSYTIRMLGGTVDGETMGVSDAPLFKNGDREILFVQNNGTQFVPLVGIMHGHFHITRDRAGHDALMTSQGYPIKNLAHIGHDQDGSGDDSGVSPDEFKAAVRNRVHLSQ